MKSSNLFGAAFMTSALVLSPVVAYADEIQTNDDIDADDVHIAVTGNFVEKADTLFNSEEEAVNDMKKHQKENLTEKNIVVYENIKQEIVNNVVKYMWDYEWNYGRIDIDEDTDTILNPNDEPIINDNSIIEPDTSDDKHVSEDVVVEDANHHNEFVNESSKTPNTSDDFRIVAVQGFAVMIIAAITALFSRIF